MQRYIFKPSPEQFATLSKHQRNFLNTIFITKDSTNRASHLIEWYAMSGHSAASIGHEINALISKIECILYQFTIIEKYQTAEFYVIKQELLFIKNELHTTYTELIQTTEWTRSNALESTEQKRKLEREIKFNTLANLLGALNRR